MTSYFMRFTPMVAGAYNNRTIAYVLDLLEPTKYVVAREQGTREHFHIAIWGVKRTPETLRAWIKQRLEGQWYISGKEIQDKLAAIAYCIKDGDYYQFQMDVNEFLQASSISRPKIKFDSELQKIEDSYTGDDKDYLKRLLKLHVDTNKKIYIQHIKAQLLLLKLKKDKYGTHTNYLIEKILDNI